MLSPGDDALLHVAALCPALRALSLSGCKNVTDAGVRALARECHELTSLDLTRYDCMPTWSTRVTVEYRVRNGAAAPWQSVSAFRRNRSSAQYLSRATGSLPALQCFQAAPRNVVCVALVNNPIQPTSTPLKYRATSNLAYAQVCPGD